MVTIEQLAEAALNGESLLLRSLTQDLLRENPGLSECPKPETNDVRLLAAAASLVELLALRLHQSPPSWTKRCRAVAGADLLAQSGGEHETTAHFVRG